MTSHRLLLRARVATLLDHFKLTPAEVGRLTDRQIAQLYFHARDEEGKIKGPQPALTPEQSYSREVAALDGLLDMHLISRKNYDDCVAKLKAKHGVAAEGEGTANG